MRANHLTVFVLSLVLANFAGAQNEVQAESKKLKLRKVKDVVVYQHERFYAGGPATFSGWVP